MNQIGMNMNMNMNGNVPNNMMVNSGVGNNMMEMMKSQLMTVVMFTPLKIYTIEV